MTSHVTIRYVWLELVFIYLYMNLFQEFGGITFFHERFRIHIDNDFCGFARAFFLCVIVVFSVDVRVALDVYDVVLCLYFEFEAHIRSFRIHLIVFSSSHNIWPVSWQRMGIWSRSRFLLAT